MNWAREEARIETLKYKKEQQAKAVQITFHSDQKLDYDHQAFYRGGYLFPQAFYYRLQLDKTCHNLRDKHRFKCDINAVLSDLIYARILEPASKRSFYKTASEFLENPSYQLHDIYRALDVLGNECDFIQSEVYSLAIYRYLERELEHAFTCETILDKLKTINFADIQEQGFIPLYTRDKLTDALHEICGFDTDFKFITKSHMKTIQKKVKEKNKIP